MERLAPEARGRHRTGGFTRAGPGAPAVPAVSGARSCASPGTDVVIEPPARE